MAGKISASMMCSDLIDLKETLRVFEEEGVEYLHIDMMDGTPIYDVKPYIPLTDCRQDATQGYTRQTAAHQLEVVFPPALLEQLPEEKRTAAVGILQQDPRPGYSEDPARIYGLAFAGFDLQFTVDGNRLTVCSVNKLNEPMEENR